MLNLTLRTLLAYIDDTLDPAATRELGEKVAASPKAQELIERIKRVTRRRGLSTPAPDGSDDDVGDPNTVAEYLSDTLDDEQVTNLEAACLLDDARLAEVAACHQILTLVLAEPVRVAPQANQRMYKLVEPPAALPYRRPGKTVQVGGDLDPADESDAALLLGMKRYSQSESAGSRVGLVAGVATLAFVLVIAVMMALPRDTTSPPPVSTGALQVVQAEKPEKPPTKPVVVEKPKPEENTGVAVAPEPKPKDPMMPPVEVGKKPPEPDKELVNQPLDPLDGRAPIGRVVTPNVIVLTRALDTAVWTRLSPELDVPVHSSQQVLALPGFKADVRLDTDVDVHLWGNVPELLLPKPGTGRGPMGVRVTFHTPERKIDGKGQDFDADLTVLAGRVYLSQNAKRPKSDGAKVRVRVGEEVWDVTLPDAKAEVMVEVVTAFVPGTPFLSEGGDKPRTEAKLAVVRGVADIALPKRFKTYAKQAAPSVIAWDSKGGRVTEPKAFERGDPSFEKLLLVESEQGKEVQRALADMAGRLNEKTTVKLLLAERLSEPFDPRRAVVTRFAVYSQTAIISSATAANDLKPIIDALTDPTRPYARIAAVNALAAWIAREPANPALLRDELVTKARFAEAEADLTMKLLMGYLPPGKPADADLDKLTDLLASSNLAVRELALWNLVTFLDPDAIGVPGLVSDVGVTAPGYEKFVKMWKARAEELKKK
ncbi:MAG TPA: hypothetical protein VMZ71_06020 [Gemmataceae bacterium]|nr:hypothetical protein [Gemmataceae bacterium]